MRNKLRKYFRLKNRLHNVTEDLNEVKGEILVFMDENDTRRVQLDERRRITKVTPATLVWNISKLKGHLKQKRARKRARKLGIIEEDQSLSDRGFIITEAVDREFIELLLEEGVLTQRQVDSCMSLEKHASYLR